MAEAGAAEMVNVSGGVTVNGEAVAAEPAAVVTVMMPVAAPEGITTAIVDVDAFCSGIEMEPPFCAGMLTCGAELKLGPLMVTMEPVAPDDGVKLVIVGLRTATAIVDLTEAYWIGLPLSATCTVRVELPAVVGVPVTAPVAEFRLRPAGKEPLTMDQTYGLVPPVTVKPPLYVCPTAPDGRFAETDRPAPTTTVELTETDWPLLS